MLPKPLKAIWGDLSDGEVKKFGLLACALMLTIGPYWMLRGIREAVFIDLVGVRWQPFGKMAAFIFVIPLVLLYSKLVDLVKKEKLFSVVYSFYGVVLFMMAIVVALPSLQSYILSLQNKIPFLSIPGNIAGWISYVIIESFGALAPALFWSFVASYTTTTSAKKGYAMILSITQIGTISGTLFVANFSQTLGLPALIAIGTSLIMLVPLIIKAFVRMNKTPEKKDSFLRKNKPKSGFFEGLKLLLKNKYIFGIFVVTTSYEIIGTVLEYKMNLLGHAAYPTKEAFAAFYAKYGFFTNSFTLIFALFGTSILLRKLGLRVCLLIFPIATGLIVMGIRMFPILPVVFISMIIIKCLHYSLNTPSKEILYIPTSRDVKFKAKSWIDVFGQKSVKASGAGINTFFRKLAPTEAIKYTAPILIAIVSGWAIIARIVSVKNHKLVKEDKIIE